MTIPITVFIRKYRMSQNEFIVQKPHELIDISYWDIEQEYGGIFFPQGTREKYIVLSPNDHPCDFIISNFRYLFKKSAKFYPDQYWTEVVAFIIGLHMGVNVPPTFAAVNYETKECGSLIKWFYNSSDPNFFAYLEGGQLLEMCYPGFDREKGKGHNFADNINIFFRLDKNPKFEISSDWFLRWLKTIIFDAVIGNTDRHQDNWGIILYKKNDGKTLITFTPAFDNGTSLGHEILERKFINFNENRIKNYIANGTHHMRFNNLIPIRHNHIEFIKKLLEISPIAIDIFQKAVKFDINSLYHDLFELTKIQTLIPLSEKRVDFIKKLISARLCALKQLLRVY